MIQIIINSIISTSIYLLIGISFSIIYKIYKFFDLSHAAILTCAAYICLLLLNLQKIGAGIFIIAVILCSIMGCILELTILKYHRRKANSKLILMLTSIGIFIIIQNSISMIFGDETKSIRSKVVEKGTQVFGATITPTQEIIILIGVIVSIIIYLGLKYTKIGKSSKAVESQAEIARLSGINTNQVIFWSMALGSAVAGLAGILIALDVDMTPTMGMNALLMGIVAMIIGGVKSIPGIALGALLLALSQNIGTWYFGAQWQDAIAFGILLVFLIFRPQGFLGKKIKKATV